LNERERFRAIMHYQPRDRCLIWDFGFWDETLEAWRRQGMPASASPEEFFGMDRWFDKFPIDYGPYPGFEETVREDRGETEIRRDTLGVVFEQLKPQYGRSIPRYLDWFLKDRDSWSRFREFYDPDGPARFSPDWDAEVERLRDSERPVQVFAGSLYGRLRDAMGVENISLLVYEDPALFREMVEHMADFYVRVNRRALDSGVRIDAAAMWEDMCYRDGPLLPPTVFREVLIPAYRYITDELRKHDIDVVYLDCDGRIDLLIPLWLEAGVNCMFPVEVGAWGADPVAYRKQYGRELLMMGGVDKNALRRGRDAIDRQIDRLAPLVEEGGFIPHCDHRVPPDVPLEYYLYYIERAKAVFGKGIDLQPTGEGYLPL
jgi:uroporphyrinogen decarboxylase